MTQDTEDPDMVERVALKPCPYCGTAPIIIAGIIGCPECASGQPNAERWNRRFEASHHAELVEALRDARREIDKSLDVYDRELASMILAEVSHGIAVTLAKIGGDA